MTRARIDDAQRRARLVTRHRLAPAGRTDDPVAIAGSLVALHSSDPVTVYLSVAARMATPALGPLDRALYADRTLLRHHAMRRTLWVCGPATARAAHHAVTVGLARAQRRTLLAQLAAGGVADPPGRLDLARAEVLALLSGAEPLTAREIGQRLPHLAHPVPIGRGAYAGVQSAHSRLLLVMGFEGLVLRARPTGTWINGQYRWAAADAWCPGALDPLEPGAAAAELARAYLRAFGPATREDLRWWTGWTVATTSRALTDAEATEVALVDGPGWLLPDDVEPTPDPGPSVALLPGLDPSTMGWRGRDWYLDPALVPALFDRNGNAGPTVWVDGAVAGGWVQRRDGAVAVRLLTDVGAEHRVAVEQAACDLESLLGEVRFSVRFPAPLQAELLV